MILIIVDLYELKNQFTIKILAFYQDCVKNLLDSLAIRYVLGIVFLWNYAVAMQGLLISLLNPGMKWISWGSIRTNPWI